MKRSGPIKPKRKQPRQTNPLKAGATGRALCRKGPARDEKHLAKVREHICLMLTDGRVVSGPNSFKSEAHHVRCLGPRTMGKRVSDYLTVPLCAPCHSALHARNEALHWKEAGIDPAVWIANFSPEGRKAIKALRERKAA